MENILAKPIAIVKAHPLAATAVVVGGGLVFVLFSGWFSGGSSSSSGTTAATTGGIDDAQAGYAAQVSIAGVQSQTALGVASIGAGANSDNNSLSLQIANLAQAIQLQNSSDTKDVDLATIQAQLQLGTTNSNNELQAQTISTQAQTTLLGDILSALKPATTVNTNGAAAPASGGPPPQTANLDFNTTNSAQPTLQGFDVAIASELDSGQASVTKDASNPNAVDITIPGQGTVVSTNPLDARWLGYQPGQYSSGGGTGM